MIREEAIEIIINNFKKNYKIISTTNDIRELYEIRKNIIKNYKMIF